MNTFVVEFGITLQCMRYQRYEFQVDGSKCIKVVVVVVVNHCFTSLFGTKGLLSDIIIR